MRNATLLYGRTGMVLRVPDSADVLTGQHVSPVPHPYQAVQQALDHPIGTPPLAELLRARRPGSVAITVSDITRPVPNRLFLPAMLDCLNGAGVSDSHVLIIIGTGMHRPSSPAERETIVGADVLRRVEVTDHKANAPETLRQVSSDPPVAANRRFLDADFRIVTGYIEPHFMAGFSGGRKGVCPALVDLATVQRFHGHATLANPCADNGVLEGNPCH